MVVGLVCMVSPEGYHGLPLVSPAIVILFASKLLFYYLRCENLCFRHESLRLEVKMLDSHLKCDS